MSAYESLLRRIETRDCLVGIIGMGYVGLPLARVFAHGGFRVLGFDIDLEKVKKLERSESYIAHVPAAEVAAMRAKGFRTTDRFDRLNEPDVVIICVPTPLTETREPDLTYVVDSATAVAHQLRAGQLVVLESTTYPGTTRDVVRPILEATGLVIAKDFFVAYSPEREDPGNKQFRTGDIPKVVGGLEPSSLELAAKLYGSVLKEVVRVSNAEIAEACKVLENTYRAVNIALVNELKMLYDRMGINVWEVIDAARTKPFGFQAFYPGPGLGGHCIPIDPFYLTWIARKFGLSTRFIELAGEVNNSMPAFVVNKVTGALNERGKPVKGSRILLLGMAYKKDVDDMRESPGLELMEILMEKGAKVIYHDPYIPRIPLTRRHPDLRLESQILSPEVLGSQDCVLAVTDHSVFDWSWVLQHALLVVDTRNCTARVTVNRDRIVLA